MNLFKLKPQFDRNTGEPVNPQRQIQSYICDYCGRVIDIDEEALDVVYRLHEIGGAEETYYYTKLVTPDDKQVNLLEFYKTHRDFVYCDNMDVADPCSMLLSLEWMVGAFKEFEKLAGEEAVKFLIELGFEKDPVLKDCVSLHQAMYEARHRVIRKLLKEQHSPAELGLVYKS